MDANEMDALVFEAESLLGALSQRHQHEQAEKRAQQNKLKTYAKQAEDDQHALLEKLAKAEDCISQFVQLEAGRSKHLQGWKKRCAALELEMRKHVERANVSGQREEEATKLLQEGNVVLQIERAARAEERRQAQLLFVQQSADVTTSAAQAQAARLDSERSKVAHERSVQVLEQELVKEKEARMLAESGLNQAKQEAVNLKRVLNGEEDDSEEGSEIGGLYRTMRESEDRAKRAQVV